MRLPSPPNNSSWRPSPPPAQSASAQNGVKLHDGLALRPAAQRSALRMTHLVVPLRPFSQQVVFGRLKAQVDVLKTRMSDARQDSATVPAFTAAPIAVRVQCRYCERLVKPLHAHVAATEERTSPAAAVSQGVLAATAAVGRSTSSESSAKRSSERDMREG
jgi:hypothetical protein